MRIAYAVYFYLLIAPLIIHVEIVQSDNTMYSMDFCFLQFNSIAHISTNKKRYSTNRKQIKQINFNIIG